MSKNHMDTVGFMPLYHKVNELRQRDSLGKMNVFDFGGVLLDHLEGKMRSPQVAEAIISLEGVSSSGTVRFIPLFHKVNEIRAGQDLEKLRLFDFGGELLDHLEGTKRCPRIAEAIMHLEGQPDDGIQK